MKLHNWEYFKDGWDRCNACGCARLSTKEGYQVYRTDPYQRVATSDGTSEDCELEIIRKVLEE